MTPVSQERQALSDTMLAAGPDAPTLCNGWDVLDLAAHLVVREHRPDAAASIAVPFLRGHLDRLMAAQVADGLETVVGRFAAGPPPWSPFRLPGVDAAANLTEFVVHHEDVRRAGGAGPRAGVEELQEAVWTTLPRVALLALRSTTVPVVAVHADGRRRVLHHGSYPVVLSGEPVELLLQLFGRGDEAEVDLGGPSLSVTRFRASDLGV